MSTLENKTSPILAPDYALHRVVEDANDSGDITDKRRGMNFRSYSHAHVQIVPTGGADPAVKIIFFSPAANKFIDPHSDQAIAFAGEGADTPYEFTFEPRGRIFFVFVESGVTGGDTVRIDVAGFNIERV